MQSKNVKVYRFFSSTAQRMFEWMIKTLWRVGTHTGFDVGRWVTSSSPQSTVSHRSLPPANPLPAVWPPWAPSRHRRSPPRQRPNFVARLRCLPQPLVSCRQVVAEGRSHPLANLAFPPFAVALPLTFCDFHVRRLSFVIVWSSL